MVKQDVAALKTLRGNTGTRPVYIGPMPTFTLAGVEYHYLDAAMEGDREGIIAGSTGKGPESRPPCRSL
jgi:hypothetical protein